MQGGWMARAGLGGTPRVGWDPCAARRDTAPVCGAGLVCVPWVPAVPRTLCALPFPDGVGGEEAGCGWEEAELFSHSVCKYCPAALGTPQQWHHTLHVNETKRDRGTPLHTVAYLLCTLNWYLCWGDFLSGPAASSAFPAGAAPAGAARKTDDAVTRHLLCIGTSVDQDIIF